MERLVVMTTPILMPALLPSMEEGTLAKWLIKEGDEVQAGDPIAEIATDKAVVEVEAVDDGRLGKILVHDGTEKVKVNTPIGIILSEGESVEEHEGIDCSASIGASQNETDGCIIAEEPNLVAFRTDGFEDIELPKESRMQSVSVRRALRDAMAEEMRRDKNVFVMGQEVAESQGAHKVTQGLVEEFGLRRVLSTPISETGCAGAGIGAAFAGLKPIVDVVTFSSAMQTIHQVVESAAKTHYMSGGQMQCPIVFRGPNGPASQVAAQNSQCFSAWFAHVPGLKVIAPYSAADAKGLLKSAIRDPNPVVFLEHELLYRECFDVPAIDEWLVPVGKAKVVRGGTDVTIVSFQEA